MEIGNKIHELRKISGMTQEQLAEKLNVSRQTVSKWESGGTVPDLDSMVRLSKMFYLSLDDLLLKGEKEVEEKDERLILEDLMKINLYNRRMTLLLIAGLIFIVVSVQAVVYIQALRSVTLSTQYMLYRYIVTGNYDYAPIYYMPFLIAALVMGALGMGLCVYYFIKSKDGRG